jgi:hypothetical protein
MRRRSIIQFNSLFIYMLSSTANCQLHSTNANNSNKTTQNNKRNYKIKKNGSAKAFYTQITIQSLGLVLSKGPNTAGFSPPPPHPKAETDQVSETWCSLVFRIPDDGQCQNT